MNKDAFDEARFERQMAAAEAVGLLTVLLEFDRIPSIHIEAAKSIVERWAAETKKMQEALQ